MPFSVPVHSSGVRGPESRDQSQSVEGSPHTDSTQYRKIYPSGLLLFPRVQIVTCRLVVEVFFSSEGQRSKISVSDMNKTLKSIKGIEISNYCLLSLRYLEVLNSVLKFFIITWNYNTTELLVSFRLTFSVTRL